MEVVKERTCLRCNKSFNSQGPQNRICRPCAKSAPKVNGRQTGKFATRRGKGDFPN